MHTCDATADFEAARPRLHRLAYRMLGSVADADDILQDAFLRWCHADRAAVRSPEAFLVRTVTRLSLDELKSARRRHETPAGPWLPEPLVAPITEPDDDVTLPLLLALERLSPLERAAFLLHDVFGMAFAEVAVAIGRDPAAARKLADRARRHVRDARPRFVPDRQRGLELAAAFFTASRSGDLSRLKAMLTADVRYVDGGDGGRSAGSALGGRDQVLELHEKLADGFKSAPSSLVRCGMINGLPGFVTMEVGERTQTTALEIGDDGIVAIYVVRDPEKLEHLAKLPPPPVCGGVLRARETVRAAAWSRTQPSAQPLQG